MPRSAVWSASRHSRSGSPSSSSLATDLAGACCSPSRRSPAAGSLSGSAARSTTPAAAVDRSVRLADERELQLLDALAASPALAAALEADALPA